MNKKIFEAKLDSLYSMLEFIRCFGKSKNLPSSLLDQIVLATEEALVNIITHGYLPGKPGTIEINCEDSPLNPGIKVIIKDHGIPFNPVENLPGNLPFFSPTDRGEDSLGGYGLHILNGLMDRVEYRRIEGENVLSLMKFL